MVGSSVVGSSVVGSSVVGSSVVGSSVVGSSGMVMVTVTVKTPSLIALLISIAAVESGKLLVRPQPVLSSNA